MSAPQVLVVEDSPTQARLLRLILESEGFAVESASDAQAALARLAKGPVDVVVSDVLMPGLTGFELCQKIKGDPALCEIPVVLVTTLREPMEIVQALEAGADSFIRKPYEADALVGRLRSLLAQRAVVQRETAFTPRRRKEDDPRARGVNAVFNGKTIDVHANREQILRLLLGTFEDVVRANTLLREREEELEVAKGELEEAARMKDIFFATLSHELRTPLTAIVGWVHILKEGQSDPAVIQRAVETIERNLNVQNTLIGDLLDVSRIVSGKLDLEMAPLDFPALVRASVDSARPTASANGVDLQIDIGAVGFPVSGDPARLQQVVTNLLTNSLKFTPRGGKVSVGLSQKDSRAMLTVRDTGSGIRAEALPHVFERFRQASIADTRAGGLGLGLAIVKHIVSVHGGTVAAASGGEGQGATFTVELPLIIEAVAEVVTVRSGRGSEGARIAGLRIVVADDQEDSRDLIAFLLTQQGAIVTAAASASEAFAALTGAPPDVLLSDIEMPDETGYSLIGRVRLLPPEQGGTVPAAAMTAHGSREDKERALAAGFQRHIAKPFQPADLFVVVADLAGRPTPTTT